MIQAGWYKDKLDEIDGKAGCRSHVSKLYVNGSLSEIPNESVKMKLFIKVQPKPLKLKSS
jgi:hypothetical protein